MKKILFIPDSHWPYTDLPAWRLLLRVAKIFKPDIVVLLGDFVDFYALSRHLKKFSKTEPLKKEIQLAIVAKKQLEELGASRYLYICGNHEYRLDNYIAERAPVLEGLISIENLLELKSWEVTPYREFTNIGKLYLTHDINGRSGMNCLRAAHADFGASIVMGHTHRMESVYIRTLIGKHHVARSFGWLGAPEARKEYMHDASVKNWVPGCGIGYLMGNGTVFTSDIPFINGTALLEGKLIR